MKPKLFIGSSVEGLVIAKNLKVKLDHFFDVDIWTDGVFNISSTTIDDLLSKLDKSDFGIFVFSIDDKAVIRGKDVSIVRDNVLYELGLYTGKLGRKNTFIIVPDNVPDSFHLPTDLVGINLGRYESSKIKSNPESAVSTFCTKLESQIFNTVKYPLSGEWEFTWEVVGSPNYPPVNTSRIELFEYENMIKFDYNMSPTEHYNFQGKRDGKYLSGIWGNSSGVGYHGTFQMELNGQNNRFNGFWTGWSNNGGINSHKCSLTKIVK